MKKIRGKTTTMKNVIISNPYDVVILNDSSMDYINKLLREII